MSVRRQGDHWIADVSILRPDGRLMRRKKHAKTRGEAVQLETALRLLLTSQNPEPVAEVKSKKVPTLSKFLPEYLANMERTCKPSTCYNKRIILTKHVLPYFGSMRLDEITRREIAGFKGELKGLNPKTCNNILSALRHVLATAYDWEIIVSVPKMDWVKTPKMGTFRFLSVTEQDELLEAAEEPWRTMILVALRTGMRMGELRELRWSDIDWGTEQITVSRGIWQGVISTPKGGRSRVIPMSRELFVALRSARHLRGPLVFCDLDGKHLSDSTCEKNLARLSRKLGMGRCGWHVLRHTFASMLTMRGAPMRVIQDLMGHATLEMTLRYSHLNDQAKSNAVALLG